MFCKIFREFDKLAIENTSRTTVLSYDSLVPLP